MSAFAKLYMYEKNPRARVVQVVAAYEELVLEIVPTNPFAEGGAGAEYLAKFPLGLVPALEKDSFKLTESVAIATYLATLNNKAGLAGANKEDAASIQQWAQWTNAHFLPSIGAWFGPLLGRSPYNKVAVEAAKAKVESLSAYLEKTLADKTFLVGDRISIADIFVASALTRGFEFVLDAAYRTAHPNLLRYFNTVAHQPQFLSLAGEPTLIEKAIVYTPPKKEAKAPAAAAAPKAPKAAKPKEDDEEEPLVAAEPRAKHPAELLGAPKSFPLDEWKRQYSNNDTPVALKWLEENFDAQDYSLWKVVFKYPEELTQVFMSANLIGGFHNRLEGSRKYLFGSAAVYGENNNSKIAGAYLIRGSDPKAVFDVAPDFESYEYTPLDFKADREFIENSWSWENEFEGMKFADGKVFK